MFKIGKKLTLNLQMPYYCAFAVTVKIIKKRGNFFKINRVNDNDIVFYSK